MRVWVEGGSECVVEEWRGRTVVEVFTCDGMAAVGRDLLSPLERLHADGWQGRDVTTVWRSESVTYRFSRSQHEGRDGMYTSAGEPWTSPGPT